MAEAHAAVAFSFKVDHEGVDYEINHEALWAVWHSGVRSWKKRIYRLKNNFINGVYPASPGSFILLLLINVLCLMVFNIDLSFGLIDYLSVTIPRIQEMSDSWRFNISLVIYALLLWVGVIMFLKYTLKALLYYNGWMYEPRGKMSIITRIWLITMKVHKILTKILGGKSPLLYSYQGSLPHLPVPSLHDTMRRYMISVRPLMDDANYNRMEKLVQEFQSGIGPMLQRYLNLKSWWSTNYVSDWWEEYVYLHGRAPIMINSNFYGIDSVQHYKTNIQAARAANVVYAILNYRRLVDREELKPILLNNTVPLCSWQYERQFNTTRVPGIEKDTLVHLKDSIHIAVYHKGRWFKMYIFYKNEPMGAPELESMFEKVLSDESEPENGEMHLAALTAGDRIPWAKARKEYFSKGVNKASLDAIEKAAFVVALDDEPQVFDQTNPQSLKKYGHTMLHGKGHDRWFDKSFTLVVANNGRIGFNAEHSWADAPITAHLWETIIFEDYVLGYRDDGHVKGYEDLSSSTPNPIKLQWDLKEDVIAVIDNSLKVATGLINDVDLYILMHDMFGKGVMKKCKMSPDAFIQIALQLAYYRDAGKFCLTYEASMTRMYREGRTETVRSCTIESANFVKAMEDPSKSADEKIKMAYIAAERHQQGYRDAMTGRGIDRHLFCLYVVSKYLNIESPFLKEVLSEPWRLSTSQTPHQQTERASIKEYPELISAGGGFGPVADDGYGVSYIIAGENIIFFHVSCKRSCPETDAEKFAGRIQKALADMKDLFESVRA